MASATPQTPKPGGLPPKIPPYQPAGFFSRSAAFIVDLVILGLVQLLGSAFIQLFLRFFRLSGLVENLKAIWENSTYNIFAGSVIMILVVIGYFAFFWTLVGFTPGKAILGLKVVRKDGARVSFGRALLRFFAYWISALPLFLGFFWVLWDPNRRGWHDKISGTQVLYIPRKPHL